MTKIFEGEINSVEETIAILERLKSDAVFTESLYQTGVPQQFPFGIWFRGHSSTDYKLKPSAFREKEGGGYYDETNMYILSTLRLPNHQKVYESVFDWLCFMQHYDVPTRILDWSESVLVALYFAVKDHDKVTGDAELIVLNARTLNHEIRKQYYICTPESTDLVIRAEMAKHREKTKLKNAANKSKAFLEEGIECKKIDARHAKPVAVFPNRWNERMVFQSSVFTVHGGKIYHINELTKPEERLPSPVDLATINDARIRQSKSHILKYFKIPELMKPTIKKTLFQLGIHEGSLFPEMDHQGIYLKNLW